MGTRALSISARDVAKAVDSAVKAVTEKQKVKFAPEFRIRPGTIIGRQILAEVSLQQAEQIAAEITQRAAASAGAAAVRAPFEPAVLITKDLVLCGFYPGPIPEIQEQF